MKKALLYLIIGLFLVLPVFGALTDDLVGYWAFNGDATDSHGSNDGTITGATYDSDGKIGGAYNYSGSDYISINGVATAVSGESIGSFCFWEESKTTAEAGIRMSWSKGTSANDGIIIQSTTNDYWFYKADANVAQLTPSSDPTTGGVWTFMCYTHDGTRTHIYADGAYAASTYTVSTNIDYFWDDISSLSYFLVGASQWSGSASFFYKGSIDELAIWTRNITEAEITQLYNSGAGLAYSSWIPSASGLQIQADNDYDKSQISTFNATISNSTYSQTIASNVTTGISFFENITDGTYNLTIDIDNYFTYADEIVLSNENRTYTGNITQSKALIEVYDKFTGLRINNFTATIGSTSNTTTNGTALLSVIDSTLSIDVTSDGYYPVSDSMTFTNLSTSYYRANLSSFQLNVTAQDSTGSNINSFTVELERISTDYTQSESKSTTSGTTSFEVINGTYNISIVADGYAFDNTVITLNDTPGSDFYQYNFTLQPTNTFNISFYDAVTKNLLDSGTTTFEIISDTFANNYTTTNGTLIISLLIPEEYVFRFNHFGYGEHFYQTTLNNGSYLNLDLYLTNGSISENVTVTILDQQNQFVEGAVVHVLRYDISTNSYNLLEIVETDFEGEAVFNAELNSENYIFMVYVSGELKKTTNPAYIKSTSITISVNTKDPVGQSYYTYRGIAHNVTYDNTSSSFIFTYSGGPNVFSQACLNVYIDDTTDTLINSSCSTGASGQITLGINPIPGNRYRADASVVIDSVDTFLTSQYYFIPINQLVGRAQGFYVWILFGLLWFTAVGTIIAPLILAPLAIVLGTIMGWTGIEISVAVGLYFIGLIIAAMIAKRQ